MTTPELELSNAEILAAAGEGIYGLDLRGRVIFLNPAAARLTGHDPAELIGQSMHELIHHTRADGCGFAREACPIYAALKDGAVHSVDDEVRSSPVYGFTLKDVIQEKFGDGIMSAIDFTMDVQKQADPKGDRVVITMNGKFLPYKKW